LSDVFDTTGDLSATDDMPVGPTPPARSPFSSRDLFFGSESLRAGWSLLLYCALLAALILGSGFLIDKVQPHQAFSAVLMPPKTMLVSEGSALLCVVVASWIMAKIEGRPALRFGFNGRERLRNFLLGAAWGVGLLSLLVFSLRATGWLVFDARLLFGRSALGYGAVWLVGFLLVGLLEEYLFRGYLQFTLARGLRGIYDWFGVSYGDQLGFWTAAVLLSFGFGFIHQSNAGESPIGLLAAGLIGVVFCLSLWRTGSLWWAIGFHAAWDWAQSFLFGVADSGDMVQGHLFATHPVGRPVFSGGLTGPEGSVLILPMVVLIAAVIVLTLPQVDDSCVSEETRQTQMHLDLP
jgi:uncharacterized protein